MVFVSWQVEMMKELLRGPIAVGIEPGPSFEEYRSGIFEETQAERAARTTGNARYSDSAGAFEPTGHAVLVVGYGVENGTKYWRVKNSVCFTESYSSVLQNDNYRLNLTGVCTIFGRSGDVTSVRLATFGAEEALMKWQ
jgi:hypothetical protein